MVGGQIYTGNTDRTMSTITRNEEDTAAQGVTKPREDEDDGLYRTGDF